MKHLLHRCLAIMLLVLASVTASASDFVNLTKDELKIDSMLPFYTHLYTIGKNYEDSTYTVSLDYPEFEEMTSEEIAQYKKLTNNAPLPEMPEIETYKSVERKIGQLNVGFVPCVYRNHKYMKLISFKMEIKAKVKPSFLYKTKSTANDNRIYTQHSVLATGKWIKISVPSTGIYQLTEDDVKKFGFNDINKVRVFGYGGNVQPEVLTDEYLKKTDDLWEVPTFTLKDKKLFYAEGPVSWSKKSECIRSLNTYSTAGYYFLTEGDSALVCDSITLATAYYASPYNYHFLYERDEYSWYHAGKNFYDGTLITASSPGKYTITAPKNCSNASITVNISSDVSSLFKIEINGTYTTLSLPKKSGYNAATAKSCTINVDSIGELNTLNITASSGSGRLDYINVTYDKAFPMPDIKSSFPSPNYVGYIENQDLHADSNYQMVIIVPESKKWLAQANRLKELHESTDDIRVKVVSAEKIYHEFSSGTPDANAYRRYLKMLYDRAETENQEPKYLLLFGSCAWDNRMLTSSWKDTNPADYLLCYESTESFSSTTSYVMEDYFGLLDTGEGGSHTKSDKPDVGIGRLPATSETEAANMVNKIVGYVLNENAGDWQNTICMIGDDGNNNVHMSDAESIVQDIENMYPGYEIKRYYVDSYKLVEGASGATYPDATQALKEQMSKGALIMNYTGHGNVTQLSHEKVLLRKDFEENETKHLPLWFTASCDIMPIDSKLENHGLSAMQNAKGGAVAFIGTTRTVFSNYNKKINSLFTNSVLGCTDSVQNSIGDALRIAKNLLVSGGGDLSENKLNYVLYGDPAMRLACPRATLVVDSINGKPVGDEFILKASSRVSINGHVEFGRKVLNEFNGKVVVNVKDAKQKVECNDWDGCGTKFTYYDYKSTIYKGADSIVKGRFNVVLGVPMDISYSNDNGIMILHAINTEKELSAHGSFSEFVLNKSEDVLNDSIGPSIYCYLNTPSFVDGGNVNTTPYFYAEVTDKDGINTSTTGIGHDMVLIVDGDTYMTYTLNDYFSYDFQTFESGSLGYQLPKLSEGPHSLMFRAWDMLNNSSSTTLTFNVTKGLNPEIYQIYATKCPATYTTQFVLVYDRPNTPVNIVWEVFDILGRSVWRKSETNVTSTDGRASTTWNLQTSGRQDVGTGLYLFRARLSCEGSEEVLKAKKIAVIRQ